MANNNKTLTNIVMPAVSPEEAVKAWEAYLALKEKIAKSEDIQEIEGKLFYKKSYWRKLATFFNLSVEVVEEQRETIGNGHIAYHFTCKATAPNGRYAIGTGSCDTYDHARLMNGKYMVWDKTNKTWKEAEPKKIHDIRSTAETRAFNRAVSNLVGGGEVSAEEIESGNGGGQTTTNVNRCKYCGTVGKYHKKGCPNASKPATGKGEEIDMDKIAKNILT